MHRPILCTLFVAAGLAEPALHLRLLTPLTSYDSRAVVQFNTVVIAPYSVKGKVLLPPGTIVRGTVSGTRRVGFGLLHERASLSLSFQEYQLPDGRVLPLRGTLRQIDNARETVDSQGRVKGILAANGPQSLLGGLWHMPDIDRFSRSFVGLTGAGGRVATHFSMGPIGMGGMFVARCLLFRMPEPEIQLRSGTEMFVRVSEIPADAPQFAPDKETTLPADLAEYLADAPFTISKPKGLTAADITNIAIVGSREEVARAFDAAGWVEADPMTTRSLSRAYKAYSAQSGYPAAPVSRLLYQDREPDMVFEKSFNTIEKRHHIRLWAGEVSGGKQVWLAAATHDVGVEHKSGLKFTHRIHPKIDWERAKVVNDLSYAGCADPAGFVQRDEAARGPGNGITTDGRLAVLLLRSSCLRTFEATDEPLDPPKQKLSLVARRMMLEGKQYVLRGNPYYWSYRVVALRRSRPQLVGIEE